MKRVIAPATMLAALLFTATFVWAGGMGGGMGGGMMGDSGRQMGPDQQNRGYYDQDRAQDRYQERQRAQEAYDRDMRQLDREISRKGQALKTETQKRAPDKTTIENLRQDLRELEQKYDERRAEFESQRNRNDRREE